MTTPLTPEPHTSSTPAVPQAAVAHTSSPGDRAAASDRRHAPESEFTSRTMTVIMRADATAEIGVGHAMRLLALAQELRSRGHDVLLAGQLDVPWVAQAYARAGVAVHSLGEYRPVVENRPRAGEAGATDADQARELTAFIDLARRVGATHCVLDRYDLDASWGHTLREAGFAVMGMVDAEYGAHQDADLYVEQNPGATPRTTSGDQVALAGAAYALFRDDVLALRRTQATQDWPDTTPSATSGGAASHHDSPSQAPLRVLAVFGGTDPMGAAPVITPLVVEAARRTERALDLTVVTPEAPWVDQLTERLDALPFPVTLTTTAGLPDLAARAAASDLVVTASGSSVWELLCLGVPIGVVCVIDNQRSGYTMVMDGDLAAGVGHLAELRADETARKGAVVALTASLSDPALRASRARRGQEMLDGKGRARVADALEALAR